MKKLIYNLIKLNQFIFITDNYYSDFDENIDIFISQACIQHFPNEKYLQEFFLLQIL